MSLAAYTSITSNYIPKARVLAKSLKTHEPDARFYLILSDRLPDGFNLDQEPFDLVININDLELVDRPSWIFKHTVVELCTAVKALAAIYIMDQLKESRVIYFDPDMAVFSPLGELDKDLVKHSILLTPHLTDAEEEIGGIYDNEMSALKHGVYNLGFFAVKNSREGRSFLQWWNSRLMRFCYDSKHEGLFTDQKWIDLAPGFFDDLKVLRNPEYNVATWNMSTRRATGDLTKGIFINGRPLCFYHFSGFDSGAQEVMLNLYGRHSPVYRQLREWYIQQCEASDQDAMGGIDSIYNRFSNGELISKQHRILYRQREDLQKAFPDPYQTDDINRSYFDWYRVNVGNDDFASPNEEIELLKAELSQIKNSLLWRMLRKMSKISFLSRLVRLKV